jgi:hypothetical protein
MRRNIVRYAMLSYVITLQKVSFRVKKRFPTWQHMVDAGEYLPASSYHSTRLLNSLCLTYLEY